MMNETGASVLVTDSAIVRKGNGKMLGFFVAWGTPKVQLFDGKDDTSPVLLAIVQTTAGTWYPFPASYASGLYAKITTGTSRAINFIVS